MLKELAEIDSQNKEISFPKEKPNPIHHHCKTSRKTSRNTKTPIRKKISLIEHQHSKTQIGTTDCILPRSNSTVSSLKTFSTAREKEIFVLSHSMSKNIPSITTRFKLTRSKSYHKQSTSTSNNNNIKQYISFSEFNNNKPQSNQQNSFINKTNNHNNIRRNNSLINIGTKLSYIKTNFMTNFQDEINNKKALIISLENSISALKRKINVYNSNKKYWNKENSKVVNSLETLKLTAKVIHFI
jgi:hypothetical protein